MVQPLKLKIPDKAHGAWYLHHIKEFAKEHNLDLWQVSVKVEADDYTAYADYYITLSKDD